ncbi:MAG: hypothetical protein KJ941_02000, partial [Bacteroidetes bacterium]|nr:hypothetical protein [Bacteroidota bacterium]
MKALLAIVLLFSFVSCSDYSTDDKNSFDQEIKAYLLKNKIKAKRSDSGVYITMLSEGSGEPVKYNDEIRVIYKGNLLNGTEFDVQYSPIEMKLKTLIPAW